MKKYIVSLIVFLASLPFANAQYQDSFAAPVIMDAVEEMPPPQIATDGDWSVATEAPAIAYEPINRIKTNYKLKPISNPDVHAQYSLGVRAMFTHIYSNLSLPYYSSSYNDLGAAQFVLVQVTVGKDSLLYNLSILNTPGSSYTRNAQEVLESLPEKFTPALKNGKPVDSILIIPIRFESKLNTSPVGIYETPAAH